MKKNFSKKNSKKMKKNLKRKCSKKKFKKKINFFFKKNDKTYCFCLGTTDSCTVYPGSCFVSKHYSFFWHGQKEFWQICCCVDVFYFQMCKYCLRCTMSLNKQMKPVCKGYLWAGPALWNEEILLPTDHGMWCTQIVFPVFLQHKTFPPQPSQTAVAIHYVA